MRASQYYIPTLKEAPADAEVVSHKLLTRAGMIRKLTSGIYSYLPLGLTALSKVSAIIREEMNRAGALELLMPTVQPADLWKESGRWEYYGKELLRFKDRHSRDYCLGPTHEEVITDLVRGEVRSYRQLPLNMYQIQTKFRDEIRPRFGLMRGREFLMKDAYSFDRDDDGADVSYRKMYDAYTRIFTRLGLKFRAVEADSGSIGGSFSHEFMVLAETGEDVIAACTACEYAANLERAAVAAPRGTRPAAVGPVEAVATPGAHTVEEVTAFLKVSADRLIKTLIFVADGKPVAVLVRGDREANPVKVKNILDVAELELAGPELVTKVTGAPVGFAGPVGLDESVTILADHELLAGNNWVAGANKGDTHLVNLDLERDCAVSRYADLRSITQEDACPKCGGAIGLHRGIEVGHVFKLGTKYSQAMNCTFLDENGKESTMIMGCYGIGVSRVLAAAIEQNHDADGIKFPPPIAPFEVALLLLDPDKAEFAELGGRLYESLRQRGIEVLLDDRNERPGVKFKDTDLMGMPIQLVVGAKGVARGIIEAKDRRTGKKTELPLEGFDDAFTAWRNTVLDGWHGSL